MSTPQQVRVLAYGAGESDLIRRAMAAFHRAPDSRSHGTVLPSSSSYLCEYDGRRYVVLSNANGVLAVYRVRNDGILKGLKRWPEPIEHPEQD